MMQHLSSDENGDWYYGLVADGYDSYLAGVAFADDGVWPRLLDGVAGPSLELACGTGRVLLPLRQAGYVVEGLDSSDEMLATCAAKAAAAGVPVTLHRAAMEAFALPGRYGVSFCAVGSLSLLTSPGAFPAALACILRHVVPGGRFAALLPARPDHVDAPVSDDWLDRRDGVGGGARFRVRERALHTRRAGVHRAELEFTLERGTVQVAREVRDFELLVLGRGELAAHLAEAGFVDIELRDETGMRPLQPTDSTVLVLARRP